MENSCLLGGFFALTLNMMAQLSLSSTNIPRYLVTVDFFKGLSFMVDSNSFNGFFPGPNVIYVILSQFNVSLFCFKNNSMLLL